jgi:hypothetical protein
MAGIHQSGESGASLPTLVSEHSFSGGAAQSGFLIFSFVVKQTTKKLSACGQVA